MSASAALRERSALLVELGEIVQAMRNIAFAELQRVARVLTPLAQARDAVTQALASLGPADEPDAQLCARPVAWLAIGAERGLCGAFNARIAQEVAASRRSDPSARWLVAGERLGDLVGDAAAVVQGCTGMEGVEAALDHWMSRMRREALQCREGWLLSTGSQGLVRERLWPWTAPGTTGVRCEVPPLRYLPVPALREALRGQAMRLSLQAALCASLQQENLSRLEQMQRAQEHLDELAQALQRRVATLRQTDITNELETLMTSVAPAAVNTNHSSARSP